MSAQPESGSLAVAPLPGSEPEFVENTYLPRAAPAQPAYRPAYGTPAPQVRPGARPAPRPGTRPGQPGTNGTDALSAEHAAYLARRRAARARMYQRRRRTVAVLALVIVGATTTAVVRAKSGSAANPGAQSGVSFAGIPLESGLIEPARTLIATTEAALAQAAAAPTSPTAAPSTAPTAKPAVKPTAATPSAKPTAKPPASAPSAAPTKAAEVFVLPGIPALAKPADPNVVPRMDPALRTAFLAAQTQAGTEGVDLTLSSGSRSWAKQEQLHAKAVARHGSELAASQWVLPPQYSMHVRGEAIDIATGASWLEANGYRWGICRRYVNEPWHFEMTVSPGTACPALVPNAAG